MTEDTKRLLDATQELSTLVKLTRKNAPRPARTVRERIIWVTLEANMDALRLVLALSALMWACLLYLPGDTFSRPTYTIMSKLASENEWATAFMAQGAVMLWSLMRGTANKWLFILDAGLGCVLWTTSCVAMMFSVFPVPAAISAEIISAMASWWVMSRYPGEKHAK